MRPRPTSALFHPLDALLGTVPAVRILRLMCAHGAALSASQISRETRLTPPTVRTTLRRLSGANVVAAHGAGRSILYSIKREHPLVAPLGSLFRAEREPVDALMKALRLAAARMDPTPYALWLFGSAAGGRDTASSDIDLALVGSDDRLQGQVGRLRRVADTSAPDPGRRLSVVGMSPADVLRLSTRNRRFWNALRRDAAVLYGEDPEAVLDRARTTSSGAP